MPAQWVTTCVYWSAGEKCATPHSRPQQRAITADAAMHFRVWNVSVAETSANAAAELVQVTPRRAI